MKISRKKRSITRKITGLLLTLSLLTLALTGTISVAGLYYMKNISEGNSIGLGRSAAESAEKALESEAGEQLRNIAKEKAVYIEERFHEVEAYVNGIAALAEKIYAEPRNYPDREVPLPVKGSRELAVQLIWSEQLVGSMDGQPEEILKLGNLQDILVQYSANNDMVSSAYLATKNGWVLVADYIAYSKYDESSDTLPTFEVNGRQWFQMAMQISQGEIAYTDVIEDYHDGSDCIFCVRPVFCKGEPVAVAGASSCLDKVHDAVLNTSIGETGYAFLVNQSGCVIISSETEGEIAESAKQKLDLRESENKALARVVADVLSEDMLSEESGLEMLVLDDKEVYLSYAPLRELGWGVFTVMDVEEVIAPAKAVEEQILRVSEDVIRKQDKAIHTMLSVFAVILGISVLTVSAVGMLFGRHIAEPVQKLTEDVRKIGDGSLNYRIKIDTGDEIQELGYAFNSMAAQIKSYVDNLTRITAEKERIRTELQLAAGLQADMLPDDRTAFPDREEFTLVASMTPAKSVGGDFYDFFLLDREHLALVVADVSGKGIPAALFMVIAKTVIRSHITVTENLAEAAEKINSILCSGNRSGMFVTAWLGVLNLADGTLTYVNAGHCRPLVRREKGRYEYLTEQGGFVLAGLDDVKYQQTSICLAPGDILFQYTDGVTEANDKEGHLYGEARLKQCLNEGSIAEPKDILALVWEKVSEFQGEAEQFDDITMLAIRYNGNSCICYRGEADIGKLPEITACLEDVFARRSFGRTEIRKVAVAVDEIYSNICYYSKAGEVTVSCEFIGSEARISFTDNGVPYNPLENPEPDLNVEPRERPIGGLGIYIVRKTMDRVTYKYEYAQKQNHLVIMKIRDK